MKLQEEQTILRELCAAKKQGGKIASGYECEDVSSQVGIWEQISDAGDSS